MPNGKVSQLALTYDDVLLVPAASDVSPRDVDVTTRLTRNITLNIPIISAAMDTITEAEMAMAMAREGGMGMLHKNLSIAQQVDMVSIIKRSESGMIADPVTLHASNTIKEARDLMAKYKIGGIPIINENGKLKGIVTNRDLRFEREYGKKLEYIMTGEELITAPVGTTLEKAEVILHKYKIEKLPIVDKNGILKGLITFKDIEKKKELSPCLQGYHGASTRRCGGWSGGGYFGAREWTRERRRGCHHRGHRPWSRQKSA